MLLDRLMVALHHALEDEDPKQIKKINELYRNGQFPPLPITPLNPNLTPKYYKGKSENDAYYGYKLVNGQTGELKHKIIRCFISVQKHFPKFKKEKSNIFTHFPITLFCSVTQKKKQNSQVVTVVVFKQVLTNSYIFII